MTKNNGLTDEEVNEMIRYVREGDWDRYLVASNALRAELARLRRENEELRKHLKGLSEEIESAIKLLPNLELAAIWKQNAEDLVKYYTKKDKP